MRFVIFCFLLFSLSLSDGALSAQVADATYVNSVNMEFVLISAGSFVMGSDKSSVNAPDKETPQRQVHISQPFYLGKFEVTQTQWMAVMGDDPSKFEGPDNPVEQVSWYDAQEFIERLNQMEETDKYRLPTEAEWEYAARAGTTSVYFFGSDVDELDRYAWYRDNADEKTYPVGQKKPNPWGLYDMYGNVYEWVEDWFGYYPSTPETDPKGPSSGLSRVLRSGSWYNGAGSLRSSFRTSLAPDIRYGTYGFRVALSYPPPALKSRKRQPEAENRR
ncbi:MAG: formylglycine-generating enzyme family protein [Candidatus Accumulibacter sp.]|jgi:formylglycine-generating enzyme required for sulfatase activity|nr:formylglycine-generating enzyme family protein [Accumulibacter sp.]